MENSKPRRQKTQNSETSKQQAAEKNPDLKLLSDLKNSNQKLIEMLREKYPLKQDQEFLGIYVDPKKSKGKKNDESF